MPAFHQIATFWSEKADSESGLTGSAHVATFMGQDADLETSRAVVAQN